MVILLISLTVSWHLHCQTPIFTRVQHTHRVDPDGKISLTIFVFLNCSRKKVKINFYGYKGRSFLISFYYDFCFTLNLPALSFTLGFQLT